MNADKTDLKVFCLIRDYPRSSAASISSFLPPDHCGHSLLLRLTTGPKRNWYSAEVMNEHTIACCFGTSRSAAPFTWPSQKLKPGMSGFRRRYPKYCPSTNVRLYSASMNG